MYTVLQTAPKNPNLKKFSFPASDIDEAFINVLKNDPDQTFAGFGDDGSVILNFEKTDSNHFQFFPMFKSDPSSLNETTKTVLLEIREQVKDQLIEAYSDRTLSAEAVNYLNEIINNNDTNVYTDLEFKNPTAMTYGDYTYITEDDNFQNISEPLLTELEENAIIRGEFEGKNHIRLNMDDNAPEESRLSDTAKSFLADVKNLSVNYEILASREIVSISHEDHIDMLIEKHGYQDEENDDHLFDDKPDVDPIHSIDIAEADITSIYNPDLEAYEIRLYNDYEALGYYQREELLEQGFLNSDENGEYLVFPALITSNDELIFYDPSDSIRNEDTLIYLKGCINECLHNDILAQSIVDSQDFEINKQHIAPAAVEIVRDDHLSDTEILSNFSVTSATDTYADVKILDLNGITTGETVRTLDELHEAGHLVIHDDGSATVRVETDFYGEVIEPSEKPGFDKLSTEAQDLLDNIHHEFSQEFQIAIDDHEKSIERDLKHDVMSHHHFLSDTEIHKTGYMLLDIKGSVWNDVTDGELRKQGLSVADGKWAPKFVANDNGDYKLEKTSNTPLAEAFEFDQIRMNLPIVTAAMLNKKLADIDAVEKSAERFAEKNGMDLVSNGDKFALVPKSQVVNDRADGLKSVLASKMDITNIIHFNNLSELKKAIKDAKAMDKAEHSVYERQRLDMHVVPEKVMQHAIKQWKQTPDKAIPVRTISGDHVTLNRNKDFSITAASRDGSNPGQRVVTQNSAAHQDAQMASMAKHGIYISKDKDAYKIGHLDEAKARYAERTIGMALRAATIVKEDRDAEKQREAQKAVVKTQVEDREKQREIAVG